MNLKIISAGAGAGKTYRLTTEMVDLLSNQSVRPSGIIATTFTKKAAAELQERVRVRLLEDGLSKEANELGNALIGTVHGLGVKLLKRFAYEAGVSPETAIISDDDQQVMFNLSLASILSNEKVAMMERLAERLGFNKSIFNKTDWRRLLKELTEVVRANNLSKEVLEKSKVQSWESFSVFLEKKSERTPADWKEALVNQIEDTITALDNNEDSTKTTATGTQSLRELLSELNLRGELFWHQWVKMAKLKIGAKSRDDIADLVDFSNGHLAHSGFHEDLKSFIYSVFELAGAAIDEYDNFKKRRGLIDYTDMEVLVNQLLDNPVVQGVMEEELDLLMVDEFQDTSPIQLEIFFKLSKYAKHSIWVGDPKQSIYGFRGAEPALMKAIIEAQGGLKKENILEYSWRSREDIVNSTNAIFTEAFSDLPKEQVALKPKRCKKAHTDSSNKVDEPKEMGVALKHWHFTFAGEGRKPRGGAWLNSCIASEVAKMLERGITILPKGESEPRLAKPGDVAILCRSNGKCQDMAEALHKSGLKAAISRAGLLSTAESKLILACMKYILNRYDSLSVAEIMRLGEHIHIENIIEDRLEYLKLEKSEREGRWGEQNELILSLNELRNQVVELSSAEILTLLLEELELRKIVMEWGNASQRLANVDELVRLSLQYEEACNRLHTAASLGGFLLWLNDLENDGRDMQGSGENPQAVNVLTYHKSKGLEYPILICHSLEQKVRDDVWGVSLQSDREQIDLDDLLGGRWVRLWVNPYSDQYRNTLLAQKIGESEASLSKQRESLEEEARLMYVGITRARDYLIFPSYHQAPIWLNRVCGKGREDFPALDASSFTTTWEWEGSPLEIETESLPYDTDSGYAEMASEEILTLPKSYGKKDYPPIIYDLSNVKSSLDIGSEESYSSPLNLPQVMERQRVGKALRSFYLGNSSSVSEEDSMQMAEGLITRFEVNDLVEIVDFIRMAKGWNAWLKDSFNGFSRESNYPVHTYIDGFLFETNLDLVFKNEGEVAIIFLSPFVGNAKAREKYLKSNAKLYETIQDIFRGEGKKAKTFVNFVLNGTITPVY